jgi:coenzyme F420-reducing hydrogenase alpha subunit
MMLREVKALKPEIKAELLESHVLHVLFLVAPDFLGAGSVFHW